MTKVKSIDSFTYAGKPYIIGDEFEMPERDARLLSECIAPRVKIIKEEAPKAPEPPKLETTALKVEEEKKPEEPPHTAEIPRTRRRYMRRDVTPQE